ncbi:MAG: ATP-grasp domain-containing protein [Ignavibacteriaceae bacterium]|nr:ATP-grasp domain-containing protein [Ignavibacteriaceae bacterium]HMN25391.1 ATP-grasp domain-containing protein [Ignavibacteriaceae bacterium]HRN27689.1 ATP-grasp domain-containing protein [Ignavibacteriaceae bacterium]HRQ55591.1 ATP-grasp domain-containing protein [Ignavibacteriaceae bacterium]
MNVVLAYNLKPESEPLSASVSPIVNNQSQNFQTQLDTYAEWDTWETINAVKDAIACYNNVTLIEADEEAYNNFRKVKPDIVFNIAEGAFGVSREAQIPAMLDMLQIPYTGSDALTLAICLDKARTKEILSYYKVPTAKFFVADEVDDAENHNLNFPMIVKPISEGSGKGIFASSFVHSKDELKREIKRITSEYNQSALVEEFLSGREFTVAVLGNNSDTKILPAIEMRFDKYPEGTAPLYSYEAKWILDTKENEFDVFDCPANITKELEEKINKVCLDTYRVLKCRDWSRIDLRLDKNGEPNIIEINPLPGIIPDPNENSSFPKAARAAGIDYNDMINIVLASAVKRYNLL